MLVHVRTVVKRIVLLLVCGIIGLLLIILSNLLPVERVRSHIRSGAEILLQNTAQYQYADGYVSAILDNTTEDLILAKTVYQSTDPVQDAVMVPNYSYPGEDAGGLILFETLNRESFDDADIDVYPVYWHGYLAILRPLFFVLTYADFRILNQILELVLFVVALYLMQRCGLGRFIPAFVSMIAFWNLGTMGVSLQYAPCYYLSIGGAVLAMLREGTRSEIKPYKGSLCTFFMLIGVFTAYFDFLTYPIATFGVPMIFVVLCRDRQNESYMKRFGRLLGCGVWWGIGYVGMWAEKWIYGSFLCGPNLLTRAMYKIAERSSAEEVGGKISRLGTVKYLMKYALLKKPYIILVILFFVVIAIWCRKNDVCKENAVGKEMNTGKYLELICIGLVPLAWYFMAANHSYIHPRLVYRSMGVLVLAVGVIATEASVRIPASNR